LVGVGEFVDLMQIAHDAHRLGQRLRVVEDGLVVEADERAGLVADRGIDLDRLKTVRVLERGVRLPALDVARPRDQRRKRSLETSRRPAGTGGVKGHGCVGRSAPCVQISSTRSARIAKSPHPTERRARRGHHGTDTYTERWPERTARRAPRYHLPDEFQPPQRRGHPPAVRIRTGSGHRSVQTARRQNAVASSRSPRRPVSRRKCAAPERTGVAVTSAAPNPRDGPRVSWAPIKCAKSPDSPVACCRRLVLRWRPSSVHVSLSGGARYR
jgi:hypothetical protein